MMRAANLLPADLARENVGRLPMPALAAIGAGVTIGAALTLGYMSAHSTVSSRESQLAALQAQIAAVPKKAVHKSTINPTLETERASRQTALDAALATRLPWDGVLRELSLVLPDDVWLQTLTSSAATSATGPATTGGAAPSMLTMTGYTYSQAGVARLLARLQLVPLLDNVQLQSSQSATVATRPVVSFNIVATVNPATGTGGGAS
jgi:Tfp pilus assembly protein PilN